MNEANKGAAPSTGIAAATAASLNITETPSHSPDSHSPTESAKQPPTGSLPVATEVAKEPSIFAKPEAKPEVGPKPEAVAVSQPTEQHPDRIARPAAVTSPPPAEKPKDLLPPTETPAKQPVPEAPAAAPAIPTNGAQPAPQQPNRQPMPWTIASIMLQAKPQADALTAALQQIPELGMSKREAQLIGRMLIATMPTFLPMPVVKDCVLIVRDPQKLFSVEDVQGALGKMKIENVAILHLQSEEVDIGMLPPDLLAKHGWYRKDEAPKDTAPTA